MSEKSLHHPECQLEKYPLHTRNKCNCKPVTYAEVENPLASIAESLERLADIAEIAMLAQLSMTSRAKSLKELIACYRVVISKEEK